MKYRFISGLPRSGSTLLANILAQNPRFHTEGTSGIMDIMFNVKNQWNNLIEFKATPNEDGKKRVLKGILDSYYSNIYKPVIFDKCRGWISLIEMAEYALDEKVKILVPVRDMRDVLSSMEKLWRKTNAKEDSTQGGNYFKMQTVQGRVEHYLDGNQPIGLAQNRIVDVLNRGYKDRLFFVHFEDLTTKPKETMQKIYKFLGEEYFEHDFDNVEQVNKEDDAVFGFADLHTIRPKVEPVKSDWKEILGEWAESLTRFNF
jgi:sulfotransferase